MDSFSSRLSKSRGSKVALAFSLIAIVILLVLWLVAYPALECANEYGAKSQALRAEATKKIALQKT